MASKKKRGSKARAKKAKPKGSTRPGGRGKTRPKAKAATRKPATRKPARSRSTGAKRAPARKPASTVAKPKSRKPAAAKPSTARSAPPILDEALEEPLLDASTILRVKDRVARSQRDVDEDALRQFADPSLVIDVQTPEPARDDDEDAEDSGTHLPDGLFAAEARRQKAARAAETRPSGAAQKRSDGSIFGSLQSEDDSDVDSEEQDED